MLYDAFGFLHQQDAEREITKREETKRLNENSAEYSWKSRVEGSSFPR